MNYMFDINQIVTYSFLGHFDFGVIENRYYDEDYSMNVYKIKNSHGLVNVLERHISSNIPDYILESILSS